MSYIIYLLAFIYNHSRTYSGPYHYFVLVAPCLALPCYGPKGITAGARVNNLRLVVSCRFYAIYFANSEHRAT